jgi:hypothetical protein
MCEALKEGMQDLVFKAIAWESCYDLPTNLFGKILIAFSYDIEANASIDQSHNRFFILRNANRCMECNRIPNQLN